MKRFLKERCSIAALLALAAAGICAPAQAQTPNQGLPIPDSPKEDLTAIDRMFRPAPPPPLTLFPQIRDQMKDAPAFVRDLSLIHI